MNEETGGRGGDASVSGNDSTAEGGGGGDANGGKGGDGGHASVAADRSHALGGLGGRGGLKPGGKGGDAHILPPGSSIEEQIGKRHDDQGQIRPGDTYVAINGKIVLLARGGGHGDEGGHGGDGFAIGDDSSVVGGQGGEGSQLSGRGGRGGRSFNHDATNQIFGPRRPAHLKWPYYEPVTEPGRGGDAPDTPQYKARRIIIEHFKKQYFAQRCLPIAEAWWDRDVVPLAWINERLQDDGHRWSARVVDDEYEFTDTTP